MIDRDYEKYMDYYNLTDEDNLDLRVLTDDYQRESTGNTSKELIVIQNPTPGKLFLLLNSFIKR